MVKVVKTRELAPHTVWEFTGPTHHSILREIADQLENVEVFPYPSMAMYELRLTGKPTAATIISLTFDYANLVEQPPESPREIRAYLVFE